MWPTASIPEDAQQQAWTRNPKGEMPILPSWSSLPVERAAPACIICREGMLYKSFTQSEVFSESEEGSPNVFLLHQFGSFPGNWYHVSLIGLSASGDTDNVSPIRLGDPLEEKTRYLPSHRRPSELRIIRLKNMLDGKALSPCVFRGSFPGPWIKTASLYPSLLELKVYPKPMPGVERGGNGAKDNTISALRSTHRLFNFAVTLIYTKQQWDKEKGTKMNTYQAPTLWWQKVCTLPVLFSHMSAHKPRGE